MMLILILVSVCFTEFVRASSCPEGFHVDEIRETCSLCPVGMVPSGSTPTIYQELSVLMNNKRPWGIYHAEDFSHGNIPDSLGVRPNATFSGGDIMFYSSPGYGATASIPRVRGSIFTEVTFPGGSIPSTFTVCAIARYTSARRGRIFQGNRLNWLHGWHGGYTGRVHYNGWKSPTNNQFPAITNFMIVCATNGDVASPQNVKTAMLSTGLQVYNRGSRNGGAGGDQMFINTGRYPREKSDFEFSELYIWDQKLTAFEMDIVVKSMLEYLSSGVSMKGMENYQDPGCLPCPRMTFGYYNSSHRCLPCPGGQYSESASGKCTACPIGHAVNASATDGNWCIPCASNNMNPLCKKIFISNVHLNSNSNSLCGTENSPCVDLNAALKSDYVSQANSSDTVQFFFHKGAYEACTLLIEDMVSKLEFFFILLFLVKMSNLSVLVLVKD